MFNCLLFSLTPWEPGNKAKSVHDPNSLSLFHYEFSIAVHINYKYPSADDKECWHDILHLALKREMQESPQQEDGLGWKMFYFDIIHVNIYQTIPHFSCCKCGPRNKVVIMVLSLSMQELPHKREAPQDLPCADDENADEVVSHITSLLSTIMLNVREILWIIAFGTLKAIHQLLAWLASHY